jgi:Homeodomain
MQAQLFVRDLNASFSYFSTLPSDDQNTSIYLSGSDLDKVEKSRLASGKPVSTHKPSMLPTYETFHKLPFGEFSPNFYNPFQVKHRRRTTKEQYHILEASYMENPKPTSNTRRKLSSQLNMTTRGVQVWFQNRRAKSKAYRQKRPCSASRASCATSSLPRRQRSASSQSSSCTSDEERISENDASLSTSQPSRSGLNKTVSLDDNRASNTHALQQVTPNADQNQATNNLLDFLTESHMDQPPCQDYTALEQDQANAYFSFQGSSFNDMNCHAHCLNPFASQFYPEDLFGSESTTSKEFDTTNASLYNKISVKYTNSKAPLYTPPHDLFMHRRLSCPLPSTSRELNCTNFLDKPHLSFPVSEIEH